MAMLEKSCWAADLLQDLEPLNHDAFAGVCSVNVNVNKKGNGVAVDSTALSLDEYKLSVRNFMGSTPSKSGRSSKSGKSDSRRSISTIDNGTLNSHSSLSLVIHYFPILKQSSLHKLKNQQLD